MKTVGVVIPIYILCNISLKYIKLILNIKIKEGAFR